MKKRYLYAVLFALVLISGYISFSFVQFLKTTFFFDKLVYQKEEKFGYLLQPNERSYSPRTSVAMTLAKKSGSDERVLGLQDNKDQFVIGIFGDSWSFGAGVTQNQTYVAQLEREFLERYPNTPIKILNFSISGHNLYDHYQKIQLAKEKGLSIDLYVVQILGNDFGFNEYSDYGKRWVENPEANEILTRYCQGKEQFFNVNSNTPTTAIDQGKVEQRSFQTDTANFCFFNVLIPKFDKETIFFYPQPDHWNEYAQVMIDLISQHNFRLFDVRGLASLFKNDWKDSLTQYAYPEKTPYAVSKKEAHPNASYHRFLAQHLMTYILQTSEWQEFSTEQSIVH